MIKPMLAYKVDKKPVDWSENVFIQPKLDGVRCVIYLDEQENIRCFSRTGKEFHNLQHIKDSLHDFFKMETEFSANTDVILDGELYNHDLRDNFEKIISCVSFAFRPFPRVFLSNTQSTARWNIDIHSASTD